MFKTTGRTSFKIHPAIGIARLGDSPASFCIASETEGGFPIECDAAGIPVRKDGKEVPAAFHDSGGHIRRQAARFGVFVYDEASPDGREIAIGETIKIVQSQTGQLLTIRVEDIRWSVYLANKKASWYEFKQTAGEHGYGADHKLRNADVTDPDARQKLIVDPGPRSVAWREPASRRATFEDRGTPASFPPPLLPHAVTSLGEIRCTQIETQNRLLVLGGFGNAGSMRQGFGDPKIDTYANNDGWFDDVSDGPVRAAFVYTLLEIDGQPAPKPPPPDPKQPPPPLPQIPVDDPAWVIVGYPRYAPEIVDLVTMDDLVFDIAVRDYAAVPYLFGDGTSSSPSPDALPLWRRQARWNRGFRPYFWRDIWPILSRPIDYGFVMDKDAFSGGNPHENIRGGNFDETELAIAPYEGEDPGERERRREKRQFLYGLVRRQGQENVLLTPPIPDNQDRLYLMPLLCGDNPLTNEAPDKFLRLTDTMTFLLHQWADGLFIDEKREGITPEPMLRGPGRVWDRGALASGLGGAFCPGGEASWIMRNPAIFKAPYRLRHASKPPTFGALSQPAAVVGAATTASLAVGLEPGDITKYSAVPWQSDFNECTNQHIDITYEGWNKLELATTGDPAAQQVQLTYWWPAHRPVYVNGKQWSPTSQTHSGDLHMVTAWRALPFVIKIDPNHVRLDPDPDA